MGDNAIYNVTHPGRGLQGAHEPHVVRSELSTSSVTAQEGSEHPTSREACKPRLGSLSADCWGRD